MVVDDSIKQQRLQSCNSCEHNKLHICTQCGCVIELKVKWTLASCPLNKWEALHD